MSPKQRHFTKLRPFFPKTPHFLDQTRAVPYLQFITGFATAPLFYFRPTIGNSYFFRKYRFFVLKCSYMKRTCRRFRKNIFKKFGGGYYFLSVASL